MKMTIEQLDMHIRRHSTETPKWVLLINAKGEPLKYDPARKTFITTTWFDASLFVEETVAAIAEHATYMTGAKVKPKTLVAYLDQLRDDMVRAERRETREVIHG